MKRKGDKKKVFDRRVDVAVVLIIIIIIVIILYSSAYF